MPSEITICNQALAYLGQGPITNLLDPQTAVEQTCAAFYPTVRDAVLESCAWTFAHFQYKSESLLPAAFGGYEHRILPEWLTVIRCYQAINVRGYSDGKVQADWHKVGSKIVSPRSTLYVEGTQRIVDPAFFTRNFELLLAVRLAAEMCIAITENRSLQADLWGIYDVKLSEAQVSDGIQGRNEVINATKLVGARAGIGGIDNFGGGR